MTIGGPLLYEVMVRLLAPWVWPSEATQSSIRCIGFGVPDTAVG